MVICRNFFLRAAPCMRARFRSLNRSHKNSAAGRPGRPRYMETKKRLGQENPRRSFRDYSSWMFLNPRTDLPSRSMSLRRVVLNM